jgi:tRNA dimethylallyltransferase
MLAAGWVDEARGIVARGFSPECKPFKSVGYSQVMRYLNGGMTLDELSAQVKQATRRYAKRQSTWFSAVDGAIAVDAADTQQAVDAVLRHLAA